MRPSTARRWAPVIALFVILLFIPALAAAQQSPPQIPHSLEGRDLCLGCHEAGLAGAPKIPSDHTGRTNEMCRMCHQPASGTAAPATGNAPAAEATPAASATPVSNVTPSVPGATSTVEAKPTLAPTATPDVALPVPHTLADRQDCLKCHVSAEATRVVATGGPPTIPHTLVGRDNCLACHQEGVGGAPRVPADHAGRTIDICRTCHTPQQAAMTPAPTPPSGPAPTPIAHPSAEGVNTCADCHAKLSGKYSDVVNQWQRSVHAERDVSCADCHGGDPTATTMDAAMSPAAGYIGVPAKAAIPALCASCHADVAMMRQYNLPTDQYDQYRDSVHGERLAQGDKNVATCYDCHGGHQVLKPNDPASSVYPANVPKLCAGCHSNQTLMAPYHIPTDQYALYQQSVHGQALLERQDFRAPTCATCHGTHGAAPPGISEVANVCGSCHSATQNYYLKSAHAKGGAGAPKCITCHGQHDVSQPTEALYTGSDSQHCGACHQPDSAPGKAAQSIYDAINSAVHAYQDAETGIQAAQQLGMLVTTQENQLREVNTGLITARAAQHTLDVATVLKSAGSARETADQAKAGADAAVAESIFRRRAMVVAVVGIILTITALYLLKRELDRRLDNEA